MSTMAATILLTLGRLPKALEIARALAASGCRVLVADPFRRHACYSSRAVAKSFQVTAPATDPAGYLRDLLDIVISENVDVIVPVSEEAVHVAGLHAMLPEGVRLDCPPQPEMLALHDKLQFARTAHAMGLDAPETYAGDDSAAFALMASTDCVVKPRHSCSGAGVRYLTAGQPLSSASADAGDVVQAKVEGRHVSSFTQAHEGREQVTVLYEGTVFAGTVAVCFERVDDCPAARDWIRSFVGYRRYSGAISFDFIISADGRAQAIECNPRYTSGVHFVSAAGIAQAILNPASTRPVQLKAGRRFQQGYSTLTEAYASVFRPREFIRRMGELFSARDVIWQASDPMPFVMVTPHSWDILAPVIMGRMSMGEAATRDIMWSAPPVNAPRPSTNKANDHACVHGT